MIMVQTSVLTGLDVEQLRWRAKPHSLLSRHSARSLTETLAHAIVERNTAYRHFVLQVITSVCVIIYSESLALALLYIEWQWRNFVPYQCQLIFAAILWVKLFKMFVTLKIPFVGRFMIILTFLKLIKFRLNNMVNLRPSTPSSMFCHTHKMAIVSWS